VVDGGIFRPARVVADPDEPQQRRSWSIDVFHVRVEVVRAVRPHGAAAVTRARRLLRRLDLVQLDDELLDSAAALNGGVLRSLDAIHLAAAQALADELTAIVTYDERMTTAAGALSLTVEAPR
jgi:predicted nucleic acid-binding protein